MPLILLFLLLLPLSATASPVDGLLERIDRGASRKIQIEIVPSRDSTDYFELSQRGRRPLVRANCYVSAAVGINWYLKYHAHIHLSWNRMQARLPRVLPAVTRPERHATRMLLRYDFNYCTFSYTMAFWDWARWEREIDWMALHGINLPLAVVGADAVWRRVLLHLGYSGQEVGRFVAGPAFQGWWLMNNLEGWGGPCPDSWYADRERLQRRILARYREWGIEPVLPGYSGMVPHDAARRLGLQVADPGRWCGFQRPAFLLPTDPRFQEIAALYYEELHRLYGRARYYSMDPFHEGGRTEGVDLAAAGEQVMEAMRRASPGATWVVQAWQQNPRPAMMSRLRPGDMLVLDLFSESRPQWGDPRSTWYRPGGFGAQPWLYCMLLCYGGNVGLHGKMRHVAEAYYRAASSAQGHTLRGIGMTMEGTENNPVMWELLTELPWRPAMTDTGQWLRGYTQARYGQSVESAQQAWALLASTIYDCPAESVQQGTTESIFCARPGLDVWQTSSWSEMQPYYRGEDIVSAARLMVAAADTLQYSDNYRYDLADIVRQAIAERGRTVYTEMTAAWRGGDRARFGRLAQRFIRLLMLQDRLLATRSEFCVGTWIGRARSLGHNGAERDLYEWNARVQITTWGPRAAADAGGLRDYAHKEWSGLLRDLYRERWQTWIDRLMQGDTRPIDYYAIEERWAQAHNAYPSQPQGNTVEVAREAMEEISVE